MTSENLGTHTIAIDVAETSTGTSLFATFDITVAVTCFICENPPIIIEEVVEEIVEEVVEEIIEEVVEEVVEEDTGCRRRLKKRNL